MSTVKLIEYDEASAEVRAVYDDIMQTRKIDWINNFWKSLANHPQLLKSTWADLKATMGEGELDPMVKEMIYIAVSTANSCEYCIHSHTAAARAKGMDEAKYAELMRVIAMASATNALAIGMQVPVDDVFKA
ncbi:MAG TPA: carboxymuconolactone decarboxylase family protein [Rhizobiales bacterium]|nr:carboxymuconolactone decarboxylase family protein [Hyphomicrobiales bacterium]